MLKIFDLGLFFLSICGIWYYK